MPTIEVTEKELTLIKGALAGVAGIQGAWNPKHHNLEMYRELMNLKDKIEGQESKQTTECSRKPTQSDIEFINRSIEEYARGRRTRGPHS